MKSMRWALAQAGPAAVTFEAKSQAEEQGLDK